MVLSAFGCAKAWNCHDDQNNALPVNEEVQVIYSLASQLRFNNSSRTHYNPATFATPNTICVCASFNSVLLSGRCLVLRPLFTPWAQLVLTACSSSYSHDVVLLLGDVLHLIPRTQSRLCRNLGTSSPTEPGTHREQGALRSTLSYNKACLYVVMTVHALLYDSVLLKAPCSRCVQTRYWYSSKAIIYASVGIGG
jgi:hypothetical protein